jgi:CubicO group peptidase (beta-lactamase class C family)
MFIRPAAGLAMAVLIALPAAAQPADFKAQAAATVEAAFPADAPGAAVMVTRKGQVIYAGGRGLADLDGRRPITPDTAFRMGSIAKQFTAALVLQLVAEGELSLDDPISRFLPDFPQPGASATVRQLLNHTSGLQDYTKIPGYMLSAPTLKPNTTADLVAVIASRPVVSPPGERWEYNNGGYVMLGAIVEKATGKSWHEAVVERIGRPLGLKSLAYADSPPNPGLARGYSLNGGAFQPAKGVHISVAGAAGALVISPADLARWSDALHHGRVVRPDLYPEMIKPARLNGGRNETYGFGFRLRQIRGRAALVHGGAGRGLDTDAVYIPSEDLFVAVFANTDDPPIDPASLTRRLAALALGEPVPSFKAVEVPPASLEPLFGTYSVDQGPPRRFFSRDGKLFIGRGDEELRALPAGDDRFFLPDDDLTWFRIRRQADGAHVMEVHRFEAAGPDRSVRIGDAPPPLTVPLAVRQGYVGAYQTEAPLLTIALDQAGRLTIAPPGQPAMILRPVSETEFRVEGAPMRLVFHPKNGRTDRLTLYRGARELHGVRTGQ